METIWLQRPSSEIPWGFRLQGGLEYGEPLSVQRVTPGSVADSGLTPGDVVLKIGNVGTSNISHSDAQDVIRGASNILQLTIRKGESISPPPSLTQSYQNEQQQQQVYQPPAYTQQDKYQTLPDYKVGSGYERSVGGYSNELERHPYDTRPPDHPPMSGYSTLPVRGSQKQGGDSFRPGQDPQHKYPFTSTGGITLQMKPQTQSSANDNYQNAYGDRNGYNTPMSPGSYREDNRTDAQTNRQTSVGSNCSDTNTSRSYFKNPTPFKPGGGYTNQPERAVSPPRLQRQTSSSSQGSSNVYEATITSGYHPDGYLPPSDDAPPPPPPPANYQQMPSQYNQSPYEQDSGPVPYQRKSSLPGGYRSSPYDQRPPADPYSQRQQGIYVDTADPSASPYQRQGSSQGPGYDSTPAPYSQPQPAFDPPQPQYGRQPSREQQYGRPPPPQETQYGRQPSHEQYQPQPYDRRTSQDQQYGRQPNTEPEYNRQAPQDYTAPPYGRTPSREPANGMAYNQSPAYRNSPQAGTGINSFDEVLSPFENFQNSNYCDKLFSRPPNEPDSGVASDYSSPSLGYPHSQPDTPRSNQSGYSGYSPSQGYPGQYPPPGGPGMAPQQLLRPAQGPPQPAVSPPPPPPPPPPPTDWAPPKQSFQPMAPNPAMGGPPGQEMPDKVLNTMLKHGGTQKPFSYMPTGMDLKKFKEKARQRNAGAARHVMPKAYSGPKVDAQEEEPVQRPRKARPAGAPNQYSSSYVGENEGSEEVSGSGTPEPPSDEIKQSQVYQMVQNADTKGKPSSMPGSDRSPSPTPAEQDRKQSLPARGQGMSFRVLQWMTDTADDQENDQEVESYKPKKARNPLLRHNSEDDEMRFSGLHSKADIPSKAFRMLNRMAIADAEAHAAEVEQQQQQPKDDDNHASKCSVDGDEDSNGLPDKLDEEEMSDKRYTGSNIPSRAFKALQMSVADDNKADTSEGSETTEGAPGKIKINRAKPQTPKVQPAAASTPTPPKPTPRIEDTITDF